MTKIHLTWRNWSIEKSSNLNFTFSKFKIFCKTHLCELLKQVLSSKISKILFMNEKLAIYIKQSSYFLFSKFLQFWIDFLRKTLNFDQNIHKVAAWCRFVQCLSKRNMNIPTLFNKYWVFYRCRWKQVTLLKEGSILN